MRFVSFWQVLFASIPLVSSQDVRVDFLYTVPSPEGVREFGRTVALLDDTNGDTFPEFAVAASSDADGTIFLVSGFDGEPGSV